MDQERHAWRKLIFTHVTFTNHCHSRKDRRLNTREHFWISGIIYGSYLFSVHTVSHNMGVLGCYHNAT